MFTRATKTFAGSVLAAGVLGAAALFSAGAASAGAADNAFLATLEEHGITPPSSQVAIQDAKAVCAALDDGQEPDAVIAAVQDKTGLSAKGSKTFAIDAATAYCPEYVN